MENELLANVHVEGKSCRDPLLPFPPLHGIGLGSPSAHEMGPKPSVSAPGLDGNSERSPSTVPCHEQLPPVIL